MDEHTHNRLTFIDNRKTTRQRGLLLGTLGVAFFILTPMIARPNTNSQLAIFLIGLVLLGGGVGMGLFVVDLTITADRTGRILRLDYHSPLKQNAREIPFDQIRLIYAEKTLTASGPRFRPRMYYVYRIVAVLRDGSLTPFRSAFKKDLQLVEQARQLDEFIRSGANAQDTQTDAPEAVDDVFTIKEDRSAGRFTGLGMMVVGLLGFLYIFATKDANFGVVIWILCFGGGGIYLALSEEDLTITADRANAFLRLEYESWSDRKSTRLNSSH